jgi:hypothetical protein
VQNSYRDIGYRQIGIIMLRFQLGLELKKLLDNRKKEELVVLKHF